MSLGADLARDPWNPSVTVLPFGLMIFLTWAMTCGDRWAFPAGVVMASFVAQTHVGYTVLALPLLAWGAAWLVAPTVRAAWARRAAAATRLERDALAADTTGAGDPPPPQPVDGWRGLVKPHLSARDLRRAAGAAVAGLVVLSTLSATDAARAGSPQQEWSPAVGSLTSDARDDLGEESGPVLVRGSSFGAMLYATGLVLGLERAGIDARMPGLTHAAGAHRTLQPDETATTLVIATNEDVATNLADPDLDLMASWGAPPEPRPEDDPTARAEQAFVSGDVETLKSLGRDHLDDPDLKMFETTTVAVFRETG